MYSYSYTYYDDGKLETEKHIVAGATEQPVIKYTYDNNGNVVSKVLSNSSNENDVKVTSSYSYNLANECVTEVHNNGTGYNYEYNYTYNPDGNVAKSTLIKREKKIKTIYTYDRLNRLTSEEQQEYNKGDLSDEFKDVYSFDDYNNILKKVHTEDDTTKNSTVVSTYDKTRLLTQTETDSENNQSSQISYTYDDNGNMSSKVLVKGENTTETQFSYDGFDRTTGIKIGDVTTSFDYNTDSDRVSKTTNGKVTESILDNGSVSAALIGETLKVFSEDNSVFCQKGVFSYNVINTKGDIIALAGSNGIDYNYNAYGTELYNCSSANPIGYRNYYYDSETGLYYLKARYYDPTTGQFTQEDTVQDDNLQYNLYGYCSANPVLYTDPSGHYNANKAIKYAKKWWGNYNTAHYKTNTQDCANFISQCLYAGGMKMDREWYAKKILWWQKYSDAWGIAACLYSWCQRKLSNSSMTYDKNSIKSLLKDYKTKKIKKGAPAFLWSEGYKRYNHAILIGDASKNDVFYWAHTSPRNGENKNDDGVRNALKSYKLITVFLI